MLSTLKTLIAGSSARAEAAVRDQYSLELIEQKVREATLSVKTAKVSLAGLIQRKRSEENQMAALEERIADLVERTKDAMAAGEDALAEEAAGAIANMENEREMRRETISRYASRILRLETSVEAAHRRLTGLKQGAVAARAIRQEQDIQTRLGHTTDASLNAMDEAEDLIARVMNRDDPFEKSEILSDINARLNHDTLADRMAEQGFGPSTKTTAADVLARFK